LRCRYPLLIVGLPIAPRVSIITPVFDPPLGAFLGCVASVRRQTFTDWEWCVVDDCSTRPEVHAALAELESDPRIHVVRRERNGGIVAASNDGLRVATGDFVALLDHDDCLTPAALERVFAALDDEAGADVDYVYTDEAHVLADGREAAHFLKPRWSPERFRSSMYTCHLSVLRRSLVADVGGFREGFDGSQDHDLMLRVTEEIASRERRIVHLPFLGYHWRNIATSVSRATTTLSAAIVNGRRAVQEQCDRLGIDAEVGHGPVGGAYRVVRRLPADFTATVVVATRLDLPATRPYRLAPDATLRSVRAEHPGVGLVVAHPASARPELLTLLEAAAGDQWDLVPVEGEWSVGAALDRALLMHPADVLVSVAPGLAARCDATPDWLRALAGLAMSPGAGLVGAMTADRHDRVLHAGWDVPNYRWYELEGLRVGSTTSGNDLLIERECSHVSLAAAAVTLQNWREFRAHAAGGFDDAGRRMSQAMLDAGARTLWTPYARFDRVVPIDA
jgi:hypothetical protein